MTDGLKRTTSESYKKITMSASPWPRLVQTIFISWSPLTVLLPAARTIILHSTTVCRLVCFMEHCSEMLPHSWTSVASGLLVDANLKCGGTVLAVIERWSNMKECPFRCLNAFISSWGNLPSLWVQSSLNHHTVWIPLWNDCGCGYLVDPDHALHHLQQAAEHFV